MRAPEGACLIMELIAALAEHSDQVCLPDVAVADNGETVLTVRIFNDGLGGLEMFNSLRWLVDMTQIRALARRYDIDPAALERLLNKEGRTDG